MMIMNMYDYKLMEKLITVARQNNELDEVRERLEARSWWDDGFKALFSMVLKDVEKNQPEVEQTLQFKDAHIVDEEGKKARVNRIVRSCLRIISDYEDREAVEKCRGNSTKP